MSYININGAFYAETEAEISVKDRSFRFGDGIFETMSFTGQQIYRWDLHLKRLEKGLKALKIQFDTSKLELEILKTIRNNNLINGSARLTISRGEGSRGYLPTNLTPPTYVIEAMPQLAFDKSRVSLCVSTVKKIPPECLPVDCKLSQGLNSTLARMEAQEKGFFEALQLNIHEEVAECSSANIFYVKEGKIYTPHLDCGILNGVMRQVVIEKNDVVEERFTLGALKTADEVFITNTSFKLLCVDEIDGIFKNTKGYVSSEEIKSKL